jgi:hypothetical protein
MAKPKKDDKPKAIGSRVVQSMKQRQRKARARDRVWDIILWPIDAIYYASSVIAVVAWAVWIIVSMPFRVVASLFD